MKGIFIKKSIIISLIFFIGTKFAFSLELSDVNNRLTDIFGNLTDDNNAGTTVFRSLNIPKGGRAESLGTAVTALCDDITFFDYNPAGSSVLKNTEFAVFHNSWIADSAMETLEGTTRFNNLGMGFQFKCFYVPFTEYNLFGDNVAKNYYSETSLAVNLSYNFFAGYDFKGLSLGANVKTTWRKMPDYTDNKNDRIKSGSGLSQSALALMADFGLLMQFNLLKHFDDTEPNFHFAFTINNAGLSVTGFSKEFQLDDSLPTRVTAGFSYRLMKNFVFTGEFRQPVNLLKITSSEKFSLASGLELNITDFFDLETGLLVSGGNPRFSLGSQFTVKGIKMSVNYTLDLTSSFNPVNHISLGARLILGDRGRSLIKDEVQSKYVQGIQLYSKGGKNDIIEAIQKWTEAKELSSSMGIRFDPAIKAIKSAQSLLDLHDMINSYGTLDSKNQ